MTWIVDRGWRTCGYCEGKNKVTVTDDGKVTSVCLNAKCVSHNNLMEYMSSHRQELKVCEGCNFERKAKVTYFRYSTRKMEPFYKKFCQICELIVSARKHEQMAKHLRAKASTLMTKRNRR